jgi:hypothetical protein
MRPNQKSPAPEADAPFLVEVEMAVAEGAEAAAVTIGARKK